jgi:hypothetical protein
VLGAGDWSARVRVARRLLAQAWLPTPAGWPAFRTPSLPLPPLRLPRPRLLRLRAASLRRPPSGPRGSGPPPPKLPDPEPIGREAFLDEFPHGAGMVGVDTASVVIIDPAYLSDAARGEVAAWIRRGLAAYTSIGGGDGLYEVEPTEEGLRAY